MEVEKSDWPNSFLLAICLKKDSIWNNLPTIQNKQRGIFRKRTFAGDPPVSQPDKRKALTMTLRGNSWSELDRCSAINQSLFFFLKQFVNVSSFDFYCAVFLFLHFS